ncbi:hypothetical protein GOV03_04480 [Candidatus Woesearchaeota archaeon]|nr:hypothetical protein [Candidatus Woesearchaeota archaeon]
MTDNLTPIVLANKTIGYKNETLPPNFKYDLIFTVKVKPGVEIDGELVARVNQICPSQFLFAKGMILGSTLQGSYETGFGVKLENNTEGNWQGNAAKVPTELDDIVDQIYVADGPVKRPENY